MVQTSNSFADAPGTGCRKDFPLLAFNHTKSRPLIYFDNAATTQKPACVLDAMDSYYRTFNANPHRSVYGLASTATHAYEQARSTVAHFIGTTADHIAFTSGATHALNIAAWLCARYIRPDDEIAITLLEHHSNLLPWQAVAKQTGAHLRYIIPDKLGVISDSALDEAINEHTRVIAFSGMSNVLGVIPPLQRITEYARAYHCLTVLDCAQSIAHIPLNVTLLPVDYAAFSSHKMYGPNGIGVLYFRNRPSDNTEPLLRGGGMVDTVFEHGATFAKAPTFFEAGTQNVAGALGLDAAIHYLNRKGFDRIATHEQTLTNRLVSGLESIATVRLFGPSSHDTTERGGIVSFNIRGVNAGKVAHVLDCRGIALRAGAHCAQPLIRYLGAEATCRASIGLYNTEEEVDLFLEAIEAARNDVVAYTTSQMI